MVGDFGDRNPNLSHAKKQEIKSDNWMKFRAPLESAAQQVLERVGAKIETHKILVLVDLQGMYLGLHSWLSDKKFPIDGGLVLSRIAFFQLLDTFDRIKRHTLSIRDDKVLDFENIVEQIEKSKPGASINVEVNATYMRYVPQFELFFAPAPLLDIEWQLMKQVRLGSIDAKNQLYKIQSGILKRPYFERNYAAYSDFVQKLKANPEYSRSEEGFFNFFVGPKGLQVFDEKEVDTRIVIRAMEAFYEYEADSLCIVSSDQDFMPVHKKSHKFGVNAYQADLAKFHDSGGIGRKLRELGKNFIHGRVDPIWPLTIITEAVSVPDIDHQADYTLSKNELDALCELHNQMNDYHISIELNETGSAKVNIFKPPI